MTATTLEKPVEQTPVSKAKTKRGAAVDNGVIAVIYQPALDESVPSQVNNSPSIRSHAITFVESYIPQHSDLVNPNRQIPQFKTLILKPGTNWVDRTDWEKAVKSSMENDPQFEQRVTAGVFFEVPLAGEPCKTLTSYSESNAAKIAANTWLKEDLEALIPDEKRPAVLAACSNQLKRIEANFNLPLAG